MIYVLVPAYNEAPTVGLLLWKVRQLFTSFNREYQLIVVNDGSTDATDEILAPYTRALPLTLLTHRTRQGYARSLEVLLREAVKRTDRPKRDLAVTLQADFSESPDEILDLIKKLEGGADIVVADRRRRTGASRTERFARRTLASFASRRLGISGASDLVGTMRGYRLGTIQRLVREHGDQPFLGHQGWAADVELLARAARHARSIESVEVAGARTAAARASRLRPLAEAWSAWRASAALKGLPRPAATEAFVPAEETERAEITRRQQREEQPERRHEHRRGRPNDEGREGREGRGRRGGRGGRGRNKQGGERREAPAAAPVLEIVPESPDMADAGEEVAVGAPAGAQGEGARKRRRRRGRGRGRGRGPGSQQQGQQGESAPPPPAPPAA